MVTVRRIVADLETGQPAELAAFYKTVFDLNLLMDQGWIVTLGGGTGPVQLSVASKGGSGAPVPDLSIEVDDVDEAHRRAVQAGAEIVYPLTVEPWEVRRFFLRDPAGHTVNVLTHL